MSSIPEIVSQLRESRIQESESDRAQIVRDMQNNTTYKKAKSIVEKHGYEIDPHCYVEVYSDKYKSIRFNVRGKERFDPEIYLDARFGKKEYEFRIQTTAYGFLDLEEHATFIERVTAAHDMVEELSKLDLFTLYEYQEEED